jgi:hypothetical protein
MDSGHRPPEKPLNLTVVCKQVPTETAKRDYVLMRSYLTTTKGGRHRGNRGSVGLHSDDTEFRGPEDRDSAMARDLVIIHKYD